MSEKTEVRRKMEEAQVIYLRCALALLEQARLERAALDSRIDRITCALHHADPSMLRLGDVPEAPNG